MNWLSWLIYLAEVCERVQAILLVFGIVIGCSALFAIFAGTIKLDDRDEWSTFWFSKVLTKTAPIAFVLLMFSSFVPSQKTVLMIAGSEATASLAATPEAKEMLGDLKDVIQGRLRELKSSSEKK